MVSPAKQRANRLNARNSTGPRTDEGKNKSSQNARTHGVFCRDIVLDHENSQAFNDIRRSFIERLRPQDLLELSLVERIAEGNWRLMRLNRHEKQLDQPEDHEGDDISAEQMSMALSMINSGAGPYRAAMGALLKSNPKTTMDPFGPARTRVEQSIGRALRELRVLQSPHRPADLPPSPYLDDAEDLEDEDPQNEPTAEGSPASDGPAEGCGDATAPPPSTPPGPTSSPGNPGEAG